MPPPGPTVANQGPDGAGYSNEHGSSPATLLALDPATLAIRASSDAETLQKLHTFALELQHYVGLVQAQQQVAGVATTNLGAPAVDGEKHADDAMSAIDKNAAKGNDTPDEKPRGQKPEGIRFAGVARNNFVKQEGEEDDGNDSGKDGGNNVVLGHRVVNEELRPDGSTDALAGSASPGRPLKRVKHEPPHSTTPAVQGCHRHPRRYACYNGSLGQSALARSEGRTRRVLNAHLAQLGLTAISSNGVISKRGTRVSHLTLQHKWNDLPRDMSETLEWWLGHGVNRLHLASVLDPSQYHPSSVAVFWAEPRTNGGSALCHYVGHYECIGFMPGLRLTFKGEPRQALIEFRFCRFDAEMAKTIAGLP